MRMRQNSTPTAHSRESPLPHRSPPSSAAHASTPEASRLRAASSSLGGGALVPRRRRGRLHLRLLDLLERRVDEEHVRLDRLRPVLDVAECLERLVEPSERRGPLRALLVERVGLRVERARLRLELLLVVPPFATPELIKSIDADVAASTLA
eukprot:CAMPEP_0182814416 /NCGR_PEP_ID=MMETSP0006_2-20121128/9848_1 /TAXON_ID=97485 /ORGANISM="Prymnesium parvum, Strain Texoma1" /LENGTH=151 /DNA_ID=CAMNT_0024940551 /DNA_START=196 /DNA_END=648 /DNA_ORIENTATION=+